MTADAGVELTDLEMTKLCAEAMNLKWVAERGDWLQLDGFPARFYGPLHDKAQAWDLIERFQMNISWMPGMGYWEVEPLTMWSEDESVKDPDLLRAVVTCAENVMKSEKARRGDS